MVHAIPLTVLDSGNSSTGSIRRTFVDSAGRTICYRGNVINQIGPQPALEMVVEADSRGSESVQGRDGSAHHGSSVRSVKGCPGCPNARTLAGETYCRVGGAAGGVTGTGEWKRHFDSPTSGNNQEAGRTIEMLSTTIPQEETQTPVTSTGRLIFWIILTIFLGSLIVCLFALVIEQQVNSAPGTQDTLKPIPLDNDIFRISRSYNEPPERRLLACNEVVAHYPSPEAYRDRARAKNDLGMIEDALRDLSVSLALNPNDPETLRIKKFVESNRKLD